MTDPQRASMTPASRDRLTVGWAPLRRRPCVAGAALPHLAQAAIYPTR